MAAPRLLTLSHWVVGFITILLLLRHHVEARSLSPEALRQEEAWEKQLEILKDQARQGPSEELHVTMKLEERGNAETVFAEIMSTNRNSVTIVGWPFPSKYVLKASEEKEDAVHVSPVGSTTNAPLKSEGIKGLLENLVVEVGPGETTKLLIRQRPEGYPKEAWYGTMRGLEMSGYWRVWPYTKDELIEIAISEGYENILDVPGGIGSYYFSNRLEI